MLYLLPLSHGCQPSELPCLEWHGSWAAQDTMCHQIDLNLALWLPEPRNLSLISVAFLNCLAWCLSPKGLEDLMGPVQGFHYRDQPSPNKLFVSFSLPFFASYYYFSWRFFQSHSLLLCSSSSTERILFAHLVSVCTQFCLSHLQLFTQTVSQRPQKQNPMPIHFSGTVRVCFHH